MKNYYRVMLGRKSIHAEECFSGNYIGVGFDMDIDLTDHLDEDWRRFNAEFVPVWLQKNPGKGKISAGLACGFLHTVSKGIKRGDFVLCPNGEGAYRVAEVVSDYSYHPGEKLLHRRTVQWLPQAIERSEMSESLRNSCGSIGTVSNISKYAEEIDKLLAGKVTMILAAADPEIEDVSVFALERYLEEFLVDNWAQTELGKQYDIYEEDGEQVGRQFETDTGPLDILAISKDKKELLVIELKRGRSSDVVVGQIQRYMGYVAEELKEDDQTVRGVIIALEDDLRMRRALSVAPGITFYRYKVSFKLLKG